MKKKFTILFLFLNLTLIYLLIKPGYANAGPACNALGGACLTACNTSSINHGALDCVPVSGGRTQIPTICCTYQPPAVVRFNCVNNQCIDDPNGVYPNLGDCSSVCYVNIGNTDPTKGCGAEEINTAIGCIPINNTNDFMGWILGWAVGVGGGIAFLLIIYASFMIMTSQGIPERLKAGQELLTSAISGLILLIFSVFILRFIGIDILKLGDFGFGPQ